MGRIDQRGFDNQPVALGADGACRLLGVKRQTLYAYVSRGLVRRQPRPEGRGHQYLREDLERLKARHEARAGHGPVAAGALRWGEPVLESALTAILPDGPRYRGYGAMALAARGVSFEAVAELLIVGTPPGRQLRVGWPAALSLRGIAGLVPRGTPPLHALATLVSPLAVRELGRAPLGVEAELDRARSLIRTLAAGLALGLDPARVPAALVTDSVAGAAARALGARGARAVRAIEQVLVLSADHELNASSFTARVAASAGADLFPCIAAALQTMTGSRHGGAADRVEALVAEASEPGQAASILAARHRRGEAIPGFGHPLYPGGDPRGRRLLAITRRLPTTRAGRAVHALVAAMARAGGEPPTLDLGLVAVTAALGLPPGAASGLFALGRCAGWIAHALEQRAQGFLLRPRARYTGAPPIEP